MGKLYCGLKKNPIIIGIIGVVFVIGIMAGYQYFQSDDGIDPKYINEDLEQEWNVDSINDPILLTEYFLSGLKQDDLDKMLRGCAIDERLMNVSVHEQIRTKEIFYTDLTIAPSGNWGTYNEMSSGELTFEYVQSIQKLKDVFPSPDKIKIKSVDLANPDQQLQMVYQEEIQDTLAVWGGDLLCEVLCLLEYEGQSYVVGITLNHYGDWWKVFEIGGRLSQTNVDRPARQITEEEYEELKGTMSLKQYFRILKKENVSFEILLDKKENKKNPDALLLPPNYFILNPLKEENPKQTIKNFVLNIQKSNLCKAMAYCMTVPMEELDRTTPQILEKQAEIAKELKRYCYDFLGVNFRKEDDRALQKGTSYQRVIDKLNPKYFMYYDMTDLMLVQDNGEEQEYVGCFYYSGDRFLTGFTLENNDGWQIKSFSASVEKLENGETRKITESQYTKILEKYKK